MRDKLCVMRNSRSRVVDDDERTLEKRGNVRVLSGAETRMEV